VRMSEAAARGWAQCVIGSSVADRKLAPGVSAAADARRPTDAVVLETVPAVVVVLDAQGRVVELNRAGEELTGYSGEEIRGRMLWETGLVPEEEQSGTREVFARLRAGDFPNRYENHWITKDGRWRRCYSGWTSRRCDGAGWDETLVKQPGRGLLELFPTLASSRIFGLYREVIETGESVAEDGHELTALFVGVAGARLRGAALPPACPAGPSAPQHHD
jgi:PAS domain S-box-containing protein